MLAIPLIHCVLVLNAPEIVLPALWAAFVVVRVRVREVVVVVVVWTVDGRVLEVLWIGIRKRLGLESEERGEERRDVRLVTLKRFRTSSHIRGSSCVAKISHSAKN